MRLLKVKAAGHHVVKNSGWFRIHRNKTIIAGPSGTGKAAVLRALQSINPPPAIENINPFLDYPKYIQKGNYKRKILPSKKTAAFGVFVCDDLLRSELAKIDPVFLETDRIEAGRRLDWNRWISFVEISGSSRWSELVQDMEQLKKFTVKSNLDAGLIEQYDTITQLALTDRVKGKIAENLSSWLGDIKSHLDDSQQERFQKAFFKVERAKRFQEARKLTAEHLPLFVYFSDDFIIHPKIHLKKIGKNTVADLYTGRDFGNLCFLKALGFKPDEIGTVNRNIFDERLPAIQIACEAFCRKIRQDRPEFHVNLTVRFEDGFLHVLNVDNAGNKSPLNKMDKEFIWLVSLYALLEGLVDDNKSSEIILLLDEPGKKFSQKKQHQIRQIISRLSKKYQTIYTTCSLSMIDPDNLDQVRVAELIDKVTGVTLRDNIATMEGLENLLTRA